MACLSVSFEAILAGAAGPVEAEAAASWLHKRRLYERPKDLVTLDDSPPDMRINPGDLNARQTHVVNQQEPTVPRARQSTGGSPPPGRHCRARLSSRFTMQTHSHCRQGDRAWLAL